MPNAAAVDLHFEAVQKQNPEILVKIITLIFIPRTFTVLIRKHKQKIPSVEDCKEGSKSGMSSADMPSIQSTTDLGRGLP